MLVKLKRDLYLDGWFFKSSRWGTEIPEIIGDKPVLPFEEWAKTKKGFALPKDAEILSGPLAKKKKDEPLALSQINKSAAAPRSFVDAMKSEDE